MSVTATLSLSCSLTRLIGRSDSSENSAMFHRTRVNIVPLLPPDFYYTGVDLTLLIQDSHTRPSSPMDSFMYVLKSSEARRQYPKRLKLFFVFIGVGGTLPEQASDFLSRLKKDTTTEQQNFLQ